MPEIAIYLSLSFSIVKSNDTLSEQCIKYPLSGSPYSNSQENLKG